MEENEKKYSKVHFEPWEGNAYKRGLGVCGFDREGHIVYGTEDNPGVKILVLGESHYCAKTEDDRPSLTNDIINDLLDPESEHEPYKNTYTKFIKSLTGFYDGLTNDQKRDAWNHILFYNYVQEAMNKPRQSPSEKQFYEAQAPFFEVLERNSPDMIIVWGKRLYNRLPRYGKQHPDLDLPLDLGKDCSLEIWAYEVKGKWIPVLSINHPSGAYSYKKWATAIRCFIIKYLNNDGK